MESFVHSHILRMSYQLSLLKNSSLTWTFIYSTSRLYGALTEKMTMKEMFVFMLTTGRTTEENLQSLTILKICVKTGTQKVSSHPIKMAVN